MRTSNPRLPRMPTTLSVMTCASWREDGRQIDFMAPCEMADPNPGFGVKTTCTRADEKIRRKILFWSRTVTSNASRKRYRRGHGKGRAASSSSSPDCPSSSESDKSKLESSDCSATTVRQLESQPNVSHLGGIHLHLLYSSQ